MNSSSLFIDGSLSSGSHECVKITNPKIIEFYKTNPNINFERINLLLLDILQHRIDSGECVEGVILNALKPEEKHKIDELSTFSKKTRDAVHMQIQRISHETTLIKNAYICEFRAITNSGFDECQMKNNNNHFTEKMKDGLSSVLNCRNTSGIADRANAMLRQFHKILNANVDAFLSNPNSDNDQTTIEYITNFDSNTIHMINAINQLLLDYAALKDKQMQTIIESLRKREDVSPSYYKLIYELNDFLHQFEMQDEPKRSFDIILSKMFPTASVNSDAESKSHSIIREDKPSIYMEIHDSIDRNVGTSEVKTFLKSAINKNMASILVSRHTGISSKSDYQIEIQNNRVILYLHRLDTNLDKLQIAVDMIDSLSNKLEEFGSNTEQKYSVPKDVLDDVNREYQQFIIQKESIVGLLKDQQKRLLAQIEEMRFTSLDKYLSTRYSSCKRQGYICDLCHVFNVPTLKGLAAHKRGCARKMQALITEENATFPTKQ